MKRETWAGLGDAENIIIHSTAFVLGMSMRLRCTMCGIPTARQAAAAAAAMLGDDRILVARGDTDAEQLEVPGRDQAQFKFDVPSVVKFVRGSRHLRRLSQADEAASDIFGCQCA